MNIGRKKLVIFGASGNLSQTKLIPIILNSKMYQQTEIILYSRHIPETGIFHEIKNLDDGAIRIIQGDYVDVEKLKSIFNNDLQVVIHFALPANKQIEILNVLETLNKKITVSIDKPHFTSVDDIKKVMKYKNLKILLIDHFLVKDVFLAVESISKKRKNELFYDEKIEKIKLYAIEEITAQNRNVFDKDGIIKDMIATHLFNLYDSLFDGKGLENLEFVAENFRGQYENYEFVDSKTPTFSYLAFKSKRGHTVEFLSGKALSCKKTGIELIHGDDITVISLFPDKRIQHNNEIIIDDQKIKNLPNYSGNEGYERILDFLINNKEFPTVPFKSVICTFSLFDQIEKGKTKLVRYQPGIDVEKLINESFFS